MISQWIEKNDNTMRRSRRIGKAQKRHNKDPNNDQDNNEPIGGSDEGQWESDGDVSIRDVDTVEAVVELPIGGTLSNTIDKTPAILPQHRSSGDRPGAPSARAGRPQRGQPLGPITKPVGERSLGDVGQNVGPRVDTLVDDVATAGVAPDNG